MEEEKMDELEKSKNEILIYNNSDNIKVEVLYANENVWLNANAIAELFDIDVKTVYKHINNIYSDEELSEDSTVAKNATVGKTGQKYETKYYNLDMIISIGFRTNSKKAISFRTWANKLIKDYMIQGFALDDERFMKGKKGDQEYFRVLLERIKLIRTSERMFYQKITDVFAECSIDYDRNSEITRDFYATIQNKFHYAITKNTAAEIIYNRVDSSKENMGLTNWQKSPTGKILKSDIGTAKNYLTEKELKGLNNLVNLYLDLAESNAEREIPMKMSDWVEEINTALRLMKYDILIDKGSISHEQASEKAVTEYDKYKIIQDKKYLSDFDRLINETTSISSID